MCVQYYNNMTRYAFCAVFLLLCLMPVLQCQQQQRTCSDHTCKPPYCRCPGHSIPGGLRPADTPQMVLLTFDDAVNWDNWDFYSRLFPSDGRRRNPNGCPQTATFFVSHEYTDYCMVRKLHARGMEIGDHSVTHKLPRKWWTDANVQEIGHEVLNQRRNIAERAHIPEHEIRGWRSPFLQPAGDDLFSVLYNNNFTYDASMTYSFPKNLYSPVLWPFTLDFGFTLVCNIARCPKRSYPGFWVVPVVVNMDYREQKPCAYIDHCDNMPQTTEDAYQFLWNNFLRNYRSNRAPLYLNLHSPWLSQTMYLDAMDQFLEKLSQMNDVYVITNHQALEWQMNPTPLDTLRNNFQPWACPGYAPNQEDRKFCKFSFRHKGKIEKRHKVNPDQNRKKELFEKIVKKSADSEAVLKVNNTRVHFGPGDGAGRVVHHHDHRTHRPWYLRSSSTTTTIISPITLITGVIASCCMSLYYHSLIFNF